MRGFFGLCVVCAAIVSSTPAGTSQDGSAPNVLLVTIDTLRADRLGSYGYAAARTPVLDALASSAVRFADATAHAPLTYPSHVSLLTGRYPGAFGVRLNGMNPLPPSATTLAERLKQRGYQTGAVVATAVLDQSYGLNQGFDDYDDAIAVTPRATIPIAELQRPASVVTVAGEHWIKAQQKAPWFLWLHYYDPHLPYSAPSEYAAAAPGRPYDAEVAYVDAQLGVLLKNVDRQKTIIVIAADHGEALGDHGEPDHGFFLYDATLHVPLIIAAPGLTPRVVREQVRNIDVAPTIADLAGAPAAAADADSGVSLRGLLEGKSRGDVPVSLAESWYPRLHFGWSELRSARVGEWKYVAAPKPELYDLRTDSGERKNVLSERGSVAGRLASEVTAITSRFAAREPVKTPQPDAESVRRLQALGYVGSLAPSSSGAGEDPKSRIDDYRRYRELFNRALGSLTAERPAEAVAQLQQIVKLNVRAFEAHLYLGNAYFLMGKHDAAIGEYDVASQLNPSLAAPHFEAAKALSATGDTAAAVVRAQRGLELEPQSFYGHYTLGVVFQKAGEWREALGAFGRAVELNGNDARARANLAGAAMRLENLSIAQSQFEAMILLGYQVAPAHYNLGVIALRRGNRTEAERRFKLALQADPKFTAARSALARLK